MNKKFIQNKRQTGAVSLFVVIFAALLMTIVTVGFIQLMVKDQQQATANDLSQSAYDSAQAGVEDAKRLLLAQQAACSGTASADCAKYTAAINSNACNTLEQGGLVSTTNGETIVQQSGNDKKLDQAYTCVKITPNTVDYQGQVAKDASVLIPLRGTGPFDTIVVKWFSRDDLAAGNTTVKTSATGPVTLPPVGTSWDASVPALLRTQVMQTGSNFKLSDFDSGANSSTLFLYPMAVLMPLEPTLPMTLDTRQAGGATMKPQPVACAQTLSASVLYACSAKIQLSAPADGDVVNRNAFLRLSALYNHTHFTVSLEKTGVPILFSGVQPSVDSTGRANNLFRRIQARVELSGNMSYPEAAVDLAGGLCKNFIVTNDPKDYNDMASSCVAPPAGS